MFTIEIDSGIHDRDRESIHRSIPDQGYFEPSYGLLVRAPYPILSNVYTETLVRVVNNTLDATPPRYEVRINFRGKGCLLGRIPTNLRNLFGHSKLFLRDLWSLQYFRGAVHYNKRRGFTEIPLAPPESCLVRKIYPYLSFRQMLTWYIHWGYLAETLSLYRRIDRKDETLLEYMRQLLDDTILHHGNQHMRAAKDAIDLK